MATGKPLTVLAIKSAKPKDKPYKLFDTNGLFLLIRPNGSMLWRFRYHFGGKENLLAFGHFPDVSLQDARELRDEAKKLLRKGISPAQQKREEKRQAELKAANSFEAVAREWFSLQSERWTEDHGHRIITSLEKDVFPYLGTRPVESITTPEIIEVLRKVEKREALDVAKRIKQRCASVFAYARQTGRVNSNPASDLKGVLKTRKQTHRAALSATDLPKFLKDLDKYDGDVLTRLALKFVILTFVRSTEAREAPWSEFDFKAKEWRIPAERMKMREEHIVPLSTQCIQLLEQIHKITGNDPFLFSAKTREKPISENTMIFALYRMGYHKRATVHGFRATASTVLNESGEFSPDAIERPLERIPIR
jgi:integrase